MRFPTRAIFVAAGVWMCALAGAGAQTTPPDAQVSSTGVIQTTGDATGGAASAGGAQEEEAPAHALMCSSTEAESIFTSELARPSFFSLVKITAEEAAAGTASVRQEDHKSFAGFAARYGLKNVEFFTAAGKADPKEGGPPPFTVYVKAEGSSTGWWKLEQTRKNPIYQTEYLRADSAYGGTNGDEARPPIVKVRRATGDPGIPVFELSWSRTENGIWSHEYEFHTVVDLRGKEPKTIADLGCDATEAFGACEVYNVQFYDSVANTCDWDAAKGDFLCTETVTHHYAWTDRNDERKFYLTSGDAVAAEAPGEKPKTLEEFARAAEKDAKEAGATEFLPGLGQTQHLLMVTRADGVRGHVFGTYGDKVNQFARFYFVMLSEKSTAVVSPLPAGMIFGDASGPQSSVTEPTGDEAEGAGAKRPRAGAVEATDPVSTGGDLEFHVKPVFAGGGVHIFSITVSEGKTNAMYWLGVDEKGPGSGFLYSMSLIATNAEVYDVCDQYRTYAGGVSVEKKPGNTFRAVVRVEPSHEMNEDGTVIPPDVANGEEEKCPYLAEVTWVANEGLSGKNIQGLCEKDFHPVLVEVTPDGQVSAQAAAVGSGQDQ